MKARAQQLHGRRGAVFSVRLTAEERAKLEALQAEGGGPRRLGPWTAWCSNADHRAVTPQGFARAFFEANP